jgi:hypothetical protein
MVQVLIVLQLLPGSCWHAGSIDRPRILLAAAVLQLLLPPGATSAQQPPSLNVTPQGVGQRPAVVLLLWLLPSLSTAMKKPFGFTALSAAAAAPGLRLPLSKRAAADTGAPPVDPLGDRRMLTTVCVLAGELPPALLLPVCTAQQTCTDAQLHAQSTTTQCTD